MRFKSIVALVIFLMWPGWGRSGDDVQASAGVVGGEFAYVIRKGDSLSSIGSRWGVAETVLARDNHLPPPYLLRIGARLKIDNRHLVPETLPEGILINIPQRMLFLFHDAKVVAAYPVGLGRRDWETPTGDFSIIRLERNKTWCVPKSIQEEMRHAGKPVLTEVPPGPDNPLGEYWMELSAPGYGIHATIAPASIYRMRTHGCVRLHPDDAAALYGKVSPGTPVRIIYAPALLAKTGEGRVLVEVNPDVYNRGSDPVRMLREAARANQLETMVDWSAVERLARAKEGLARETGRKTASRE